MDTKQYKHLNHSIAKYADNNLLADTLHRINTFKTLLLLFYKQSEQGLLHQ